MSITGNFIRTDESIEDLLPSFDFTTLASVILKEPEVHDKRILKGALILSHPPEISKYISFFRTYFYIIARNGWYGPNTSPIADIMLIEDTSEASLKETRMNFPEAYLLEISDADFVDTEKFRPLRVKKEFTGIQIANWMPYKRHELFVNGVALLRNHRFLKFGHLVKNSPEEIELKTKIIALAQQSNNISFPFSNPGEFSDDTEQINGFINQAKMGILTSQLEGINRFKLECMSADIPFLVAADAITPVKKHINGQTGLFFEPTPEGLSAAILEALRNYDSFSPRRYVLENTGCRHSIRLLKKALEQICEKEKEPYRFDDIYYNGRNESFLWGSDALKKIIHVIKNITEKL
ncbi:MAG: glycosyltransferase family 4 protein [Spirochaetales bacterium]|nr:glycosyltransferase family 4 protein [Spirochaetales bacterium]